MYLLSTFCEQGVFICIVSCNPPQIHTEQNSQPRQVEKGDFPLRRRVKTATHQGPVGVNNCCVTNHPRPSSFQQQTFVPLLWEVGTWEWLSRVFWLRIFGQAAAWALVDSGGLKAQLEKTPPLRHSLPGCPQPKTAAAQHMGLSMGQLTTWQPPSPKRGPREERRGR
jgi:hypothetical protein